MVVQGAVFKYVSDSNQFGVYRLEIGSVCGNIYYHVISPPNLLEEEKSVGGIVMGWGVTSRPDTPIHRCFW